MNQDLRVKDNPVKITKQLSGGLLGWYAVCTTKNLKSDQIYFFSLFNEPLVLYRDKENKAVCITDYCPHRGASFRGGEVIENEIMCPYHGARFASEESSQKLANISCQHIVDAKYSNHAKNSYLRQYPCEESGDYIYVYYTGKAKEDLRDINISHSLEPTLLDSHKFDYSEHVYEEALLDFKCDWDRIVENHLDILHIFWMHGRSLPGNDVSRETIAAFNQNLQVSMDSLKTTYFHKDKTKGEFITQIFIPPGRIIMYRGSDSPSKARYIQVLDHIPMSKNRARVIVRHYRKFFKNILLSKLLLFRTLQMRTFYNIFSEDYLVLRTQTFSQQMKFMREDNVRLLGEDRAVRLFWEWHQRAVDNDHPWGIHPMASDVNPIHQDLLMVYPPENRRLVHKLQRTLVLRILARVAFILLLFVVLYMLFF